MSPIWTPTDRSPEESGAADLLGPLGQRAIEQLMGSTRMLAQVVKAIREASRIVASRGVDLRRYRSEKLVYRLPISPSINTAMATPI